MASINVVKTRTGDGNTGEAAIDAVTCHINNSNPRESVELMKEDLGMLWRIVTIGYL
jgi:hypothetical protein